jgi:predicted RNase H-like HicB family nuclease
MPQTKRISLTVNLPVKVTKRKKWFLASCPILDVHSQGETQDQAKHNLIEALSLFFVSCLERNTLDAVLKDCGLTVARPPEVYKVKPAAPREDYVDVPIPFLARPTQHHTCHA